MSKVKYVKCPRCDLNYMESRQEMCDVCKAELGMQSSVILDDDDIELEEELTKLCPVCKRVYINLEDDMCDACATAKANADVIDVSDEEWRNFLDDDPEEFVDEKIEIPLEELQDEEDKDEDEEEEFVEKDAVEDDFDFDDDLVDIEDDDDDEEDDGDEEDEDEEDMPRKASNRKK